MAAVVVVAVAVVAVVLAAAAAEQEVRKMVEEDWNAEMVLHASSLTSAAVVVRRWAFVVAAAAAAATAVFVSSASQVPIDDREARQFLHLFASLHWRGQKLALFVGCLFRHLRLAPFRSGAADALELLVVLVHLGSMSPLSAAVAMRW